MNLNPNLETLDSLNADAVVLFLNKNPFPFGEFLHLLDWRLCFYLSELLIKNKIQNQDVPSIIANTHKLKFGKIMLFPFQEENVSQKSLDTYICKMLKVISNAGISQIALSLPDDKPWMLKHWQDTYQNHPVFSNILVFKNATY